MRFLSTLSLRRATLLGYDVAQPVCQFLSTLSLRRATNTLDKDKALIPNFYPRSPCGERPVEPQLQKIAEEISIHALLAESDATATAGRKEKRAFLSTLSLRRAT